MQALSKLVYIVTMDCKPEWEREFNQWYDEEHIPLLLGLPGYRSATRYIRDRAADSGSKYMTFYEITTLDAFHSKAHAQVNATEWSLRIVPHLDASRAFYEQIFPASGLQPGPGAESPAGGLLVTSIHVASGRARDFNAWQNREQLPRLCAVPGVVGARGFQAVGDEPNFMAMYYLTAPAVCTSGAWLQASGQAESASPDPHIRTWRSREEALYRPWLRQAAPDER